MFSPKTWKALGKIFARIKKAPDIPWDIPHKSGDSLSSPTRPIGGLLKHITPYVRDPLLNSPREEPPNLGGLKSPRQNR